MSVNRDRLYELLPAIHRLRDHEQGYPLRAMLRVLGEQVNAIEANIGQLYDNYFVETADDWAIPYIAALIGYRPVGEAGLDVKGSKALAKILTPRREVANTLAFRRRKGSLALLELIADAASGWPARAVEFYTLLARAQNINHLRMERPASASFGNAQRLFEADGPFDTLPHSVDVRRMSSRYGSGNYNIPSVGLFVWRLKPYSMRRAPACCIEAEGRNCYSMSALGNDAPLFNAPLPQTDPASIAEKQTLPIAISRRDLEVRIAAAPAANQASTNYYGANRSIAVFAPHSQAAGADGLIPAANIAITDLSDWRARPPLGRIALDPELGRFMFPMRDLKVKEVHVLYNYGFSADMGGGPYQRQLSQPKSFTLYSVGSASGTAAFSSIAAALAQWRADLRTLGTEPPADDTARPAWHAKWEALQSAVVEIGDSEAYTERLSIRLGQREYLQIRAASGERPLIRLLDQIVDQPDSFTIHGGSASRVVLDGLLIAGNALRITASPGNRDKMEASGDLCDVTIRHSTLVPGWWLECDCDPRHPRKPSIEIEDSTVTLRIHHSIVGSIHLFASERRQDPVTIDINDSIVDATSEELPAIFARSGSLAFVDLTMRRSTVIGGIQVHRVSLAENAIILGDVQVARKQAGCLRYSYVPAGSRTPRRYRCQPDLVVERAASVAAEGEISRVRPQFTSLRYGHPGYCQLADGCAPEIRRGADDKSEVGAFHDLFQPQRKAILRARLAEYTPADMDAGILFVS